MEVYAHLPSGSEDGRLIYNASDCVRVRTCVSCRLPLCGLYALYTGFYCTRVEISIQCILNALKGVEMDGVEIEKIWVRCVILPLYKK